MLKIFKLVFVNLFIFLVLILLIELIFGYWFDSNNLGPYVREHRLRKTNYELTYETQKINFVYERNYYGFRGEDVPLNAIKAVMVGGSTTDERYKPENLTIIGFINSDLKEKNIDLKIFNAGIEGQSSRGHKINLDYWFKKLPNFSPNYIFYYIGINDQYVKTEKLPLHDGNILNADKKMIFFDNFKSRSILYDLIRKSKHRFYSNDKKILYDFDQGVAMWKDKNIDYINYNDFIKFGSSDELNKTYKDVINAYILRVEDLYRKTIEFGSMPIFITQVDAAGYGNEKLIAMNSALMDFCSTNNIFCIDIAKKLNGKRDFWWDGLHTTPKGSRAIASIISEELIKFLQSQNSK